MKDVPLRSGAKSEQRGQEQEVKPALPFNKTAG